MNAEWFEALPEQCPPTDAKRCEGCYYRIANGNPVTTEDFFSQRKMQPDKVFKGVGIDECVTEIGIAHYSWWRTKDFNVLQAKIV